MEDQPTIFINYRRDDTTVFARLLYAELENHFGDKRIFQDTEKIAYGADFVEVFSEHIASCKVFLAVIGKNWLSIAAKKRSAKLRDHAHLEICSALKRNAQSKGSIVVIPLLVDGASMPSEEDLPDGIKKLADLNIYEFNEKWLDEGLERLIKQLEKVVGKPARDESHVALTAEEKTTDGQTEISTEAARWSVPSSRSIVVGTLLGLITSAFVAINAKQYEGVLTGRFGVALIVGLWVGFISSWSINLGLSIFMKLFKGSWYSKILGGAVGGSIGGILAIIVGGLPYFWSSQEAERNTYLNDVGGGETVKLILIFIALVVSTCGIALGILAPRGKEWFKALQSLIIALSLPALILLVAIRYVDTGALENLGLETSFSSVVVTFGVVSGLMSGLQIVAMLMIYDHLNKSENTRSVRVDLTS